VPPTAPPSPLALPRRGCWSNTTTR